MNRDCIKAVKLDNGFVRTYLVKCPCCGNENLAVTNVAYEEAWGSLVESEWDYYCKKCDDVVGHWAYGNVEFYDEEE